jgi:hypothetical protein
VIELIYASTAHDKLSECELRDLLDVSRRNNAAAGITGMLLYRDGNFLQILEGGREAVHALLDRIKADRRHFGVMVVLETEIERRSFDGWSMGFRALEPGENAEADDLFSLTAPALASRIPPEAPKRIATFLRTFYVVTGG